MTDIAYDIQVLEDVLTAMQEGASDEKRMALWSLERLLQEKQKILDAFEEQAG